MTSSHFFNYRNFGRLWRVYGRSVLFGSTPKRLINALRTEISYRRRSVAMTSKPYVLFIEPLYYCNLNCPLCPRELRPDVRTGREAGRLPDDLIGQIFDELGDYLYQCHIFGNGEPMLDWPRTKSIIEAAHRRRIFTLASTNCTIMTPETAREVVTSGLDYLVCAVDGLTQETYGYYRVGGQVDVALAGLQMIAEAKRATKSRINLEWQFLVHSKSIHELEQARKLAGELGLFFRPTPIGGITTAEQAKKWLPAGAEWNDNPTKEKPRRDFPCYWLWRALVVNSNGQLGRCPAESNAHQLGSFRGKSIMSVYNGPATHRARQLFSRRDVAPGDFPAPCVTCNYFDRHHGSGKPGYSEPSVEVASSRSGLSLTVRS